MNGQRLGIEVPGARAEEVLSRIRRAEELGIHSAWLTTGGTAVVGGGVRRDSLALLAAAAAQTDRIALGTAILVTWPRHPIAVVEYVQIVDQIAPGRFRLGLGTSGKAIVEQAYGTRFTAPMSQLREYVKITRTILTEASVDFKGDYYSSTGIIGAPVDVPVMISAVQPGAFEVAGAETDGAISWICPITYLRDHALPAIQKGAESVGRPTPPLIAHAIICVHDDEAEAKAAFLERFTMYMGRPNYARMFTTAGYPEVHEGVWSDGMIKSVMYSGNEEQVAQRLAELLAIGPQEVFVTPLAAGSDRAASFDRALRLVGGIAKSLN
jgi:alkanesulfonate monooxygenase SsuD/methylene tetrahydromethanopterin reductase-like flavin-dependent oxidoreductase (luciferase family)